MLITPRRDHTYQFTRVLAAALAVSVLSVTTSRPAHAGCAPKFTGPTTWQSSQHSPIAVSGTITLQWQANCSAGINYNEVIIYAGCTDSGGGFYCRNPFPPPDYITLYYGVSENATSINFNTNQLLVSNQYYDINVAVIASDGGTYSTHNDCTAPSGDCDIVVYPENGGGGPSPTPTPSRGGNCSVTLSSPNYGAVVSGDLNVSINESNCPGYYKLAVSNPYYSEQIAFQGSSVIWNSSLLSGSADWVGIQVIAYNNSAYQSELASSNENYITVHK